MVHSLARVETLTKLKAVLVNIVVELIELDYAAGSIGIDLLASFPVTKVTLTPNSPIHRVRARNLLVGVSDDNITYRMVDGWKVVAGEKGVLEMVFDTPVDARYIKIKCLYDNRTDEFAPVENMATFINTPEKIIKVHYLVTSRQEQYTYDEIGNRKTETIIQRYPVTRNYEYYPNSSRLMTNGKYHFEYDNNGNLVKKTSADGSVIWEYQYDLLNRLESVTKNGVQVASYIYDESGLRLKKQGKDKAVYYVFDTGGNVLYEQENREYLEYIYVLGKHFARVDGNLDNSIRKKYFYHTDHLGSTVAVTDEAGQTVWASEYTPFGGKHSTEGELAHAAKFTGKDLDEDIGLYYFNARWYDQEIGRFVTEDSYRGDPNDPRTLNYYSYGANNPLLFIDPTGHTFEQFLGNILTKLANKTKVLDILENKDTVKENLEKRDDLARNTNGNSIVATAQASLAIAGYDLGRAGVDGIQGEKTTAAIIEFQQAVGLKPTGEIDTDTMVALSMVTGAGLKKEDIDKLGQALGHLDDRLTWPTKSQRITSDFGPRVHPITGEQLSFHSGVDIGAIVPGIEGDKVVSAAEGIVVISGYQFNEKTSRGAGNYLVIESTVNGVRFQALYMHLQDKSKVVKEKDLVRAGQHIANMGNTGGSTAPHLHFEIRVYKNGAWVPVDPTTWKYK